MTENIEKITKVIKDQFETLNKDRTVTHDLFFKKMEKLDGDISEVKITQAQMLGFDGRLKEVEEDIDSLKMLRAHFKGAVAAVASIISLFVSGIVWFFGGGNN